MSREDHPVLHTLPAGREAGRPALEDSALEPSAGDARNRLPGPLALELKEAWTRGSWGRAMRRERGSTRANS